MFYPTISYWRYCIFFLVAPLQDAGFTTEVHHITGEGKDGGVVYCEMQGCENTGESLVNVELQREIYPGHCGYKSVTGGIMKNLRDSTTNEKIKAYHRTYYRPENLCLIITGQVEAEKVFEVLKPFEEKIMSKVCVLVYSFDKLIYLINLILANECQSKRPVDQDNGLDDLLRKAIKYMCQLK